MPGRLKVKRCLTPPACWPGWSCDPRRGLASRALLRKLQGSVKIRSSGERVATGSDSISCVVTVPPTTVRVVSTAGVSAWVTTIASAVTPAGRSVKSSWTFCPATVVRSVFSSVAKLVNEAFKVVNAWFQLDQTIPSIRIRYCRAFCSGFDEGRRDCRAGNDGAVLIGNSTSEGNVVEILRRNRLRRVQV